MEVCRKNVMMGKTKVGVAREKCEENAQTSERTNGTIGEFLFGKDIV